MGPLLYILVITTALFCFAYFILIASYCYAWVRTKTPILHSNVKTSVTVIIAARNEEDTIETCLTSILQQSYPSHLFEVIIVDDASEDATNRKLKEFCDTHKHIQLITLDKNANLLGKKNALNVAIKEAKGELIITTDADCIMGNNWLNTMVSYYTTSNPKMIVAPVCFYDERSIFEKMQSLEFMALISSAGASLYFNKAILCNGANLAYTKDVFNEVNGFEGIDQQPSGDDVLLMYKIAEKYPKSIHFLKRSEAIVYTKAKSTVAEFMHQRMRWASKGFNALNTDTKLVSSIVYLFNLFLLTSTVFSLFYCKNQLFPLSFFKICLILFGIKCFIDFLLLFLSASFFRKRHFLIYFLPEQFLYVIYVVMVGILGSIGNYEWKGRKNKR